MDKILPSLIPIFFRNSFSSFSLLNLRWGVPYLEVRKGRQYRPLGARQPLSQLGWMKLEVTTVRFHAGSHFLLASSGAFSSRSVSLLSGGTSHEQRPTWTIKKGKRVLLLGIISYFFDRMTTPPIKAGTIADWYRGDNMQEVWLFWPWYAKFPGM